MTSPRVVHSGPPLRRSGADRDSTRCASSPAATATVLAAALAHAQESVDLAMIARIRAEGMDSSRSRAFATFNQLTNIVGPRLTGSPLHKQAADWALEQLTDWGMANAISSHSRSAPVGRSTRMTLEMTKPRYFPAYGYPQAWSPSTKGVLTRPMYLGEMTQAQIEALGEKLRGAIILPSRPQTQFFRADRVSAGRYRQRADRRAGLARRARARLRRSTR